MWDALLIYKKASLCRGRGGGTAKDSRRRSGPASWPVAVKHMRMYRRTLSGTIPKGEVPVAVKRRSRVIMQGTHGTEGLYLQPAQLVYRIQEPSSLVSPPTSAASANPLSGGHHDVDRCRATMQRTLKPARNSLASASRRRTMKRLEQIHRATQCPGHKKTLTP